MQGYSSIPFLIHRQGLVHLTHQVVTPGYSSSFPSCSSSPFSSSCRRPKQHPGPLDPILGHCLHHRHPRSCASYQTSWRIWSPAAPRHPWLSFLPPLSPRRHLLRHRPPPHRLRQATSWGARIAAPSSSASPPPCPSPRFASPRPSSACVPSPTGSTLRNRAACRSWTAAASGERECTTSSSSSWSVLPPRPLPSPPSWRRQSTPRQPSASPPPTA
mmetsp:Transcript_16482/g.39465  ORF Transcript_16482/g.39465 Transcript_16482/m.39465 type:complete len:216 (+) Transcript_16482:190-837(+)